MYVLLVFLSYNFLIKLKINFERLERNLRCNLKFPVRLRMRLTFFAILNTIVLLFVNKPDDGFPIQFREVLTNKFCDQNISRNQYSCALFSVLVKVSAMARHFC